jgi:hypothetical protein
MSKFSKKNQKQAEEEREYITCFIKILPPVVKSWASFIKYVGIHVFPEEILPIKKTKNNKIELDDDGKFVIMETPHTIQLIELKSFQGYDQRAEQSATKFNLTFKVPIPRKSDEFYDYMMDTLVNPLLHPTDVETYEDGKEKLPLATLSWTYYEREYYVKVSLVDNSMQLPCQSRFRRMSVRDD